MEWMSSLIPFLQVFQAMLDRAWSQPGLVDGVPAHGREVEHLRSFPTQTIP